MNYLTRYIILFISAAVISLFMTACVLDSENDPDKPVGAPGQNYKIAISVSTINTRAQQVPVEKIKSLRIIIVDSDTIELNSLVTIPERNSSGFIYNLIHYTYTGTKSFYLFGNEESVGNVSYSSSGNGSTGDNTGTATTQTLSELLGSIQKGNSAESLTELMTTGYFEPHYTTEGDGIFLPYTAYYGEDNAITVGQEDHQAAQFYLVPVATKFIFNFTNYRGGGVKVNNITLNSANNVNYLFGNVGDTDYNMTLPESSESLYWVNWLATVSQLSQENQNSGQTESFNQKYGWILDYTLPTTSVAQPKVFVTQGNGFTIPGKTMTETNGETVETPGLYTAGPYYVAESKVAAPGSADMSLPTQQYSLTIDFEDMVPGKEAPPFENVVIPNLKALFRSTYVLIDIEMNQGDIEIYAQITPWTSLSANGFVTESPNRPNLN